MFAIAVFAPLVGSLVALLLGRQIGDRLMPGHLAERRVPGAVFGEQGSHIGEVVVVQRVAVLGQQVTDGILVFDHGRHRFLP